MRYRDLVAFSETARGQIVAGLEHMVAVSPARDGYGMSSGTAVMAL